MGLLVRPMSPADAEQVAAWRYPGKLRIYDLDGAQPIIDDLANYFAVAQGPHLVGFCCTDAAARVPGLTADPAFLDVGVGMHPDLIASGRGSRFGQAVLNYLADRLEGRRLRVVVQSWNERSLRLARRLGFADAGEFTTRQSNQSVAYRVLIKDVSEP